MSSLIFDIETIGDDFDKLDQATQDNLTRWIKKDFENEPEYKNALEDLKNGLGFSPLTGEIVVIGVLDADRDSGAVYFQAPNENIKEFEENGVKFKPCTEKEMLQKFWQLSDRYEEFIGFNSRSFDVPFLLIRSAIYKIRPPKDLMSNRYTSIQKSQAKHIDLQDQLTFYGAFKKRGSLHLWSRAFGIESPKAAGITGDNVKNLFEQKKYLEIAKYNLGDLKATKELYKYWKSYLNF